MSNPPKPPNLFNETGHNSIDERNTEAERYINELHDKMGEMNIWEQNFITDMWSRKEDNNLRCTAKQLFKLRDMYQEYCC